MPHNPHILTAIENHQTKELINYLSDPITYGDANAVDENGNTYFHIAAKKYLVEGIRVFGHDILEILLNAKIASTIQNTEGQKAFDLCDINSRDGITSCTHLQHVIRQNCPLLFDALLQAKVNVNKSNKDGCTPVCDSASEGKITMLNTLIQNEANIYVGYGPSDFYNPLLSAIAALHRANTESNNPVNKEDLKLCINVLINLHAGIFLSFNEEQMKNIDLTKKVFIGSNLKTKSPEIITTVGQLIYYYENDKISDAQLAEIKSACEQIKISLERTKNTLSEDMAYQIPQFESLLARLTRTINSLAEMPADKKLNKAVESHGIYKDSSAAQSSTEVVTSSSLQHPPRSSSNQTP